MNHIGKLFRVAGVVLLLAFFAYVLTNALDESLHPDIERDLSAESTLPPDAFAQNYYYYFGILAPPNVENDIPIYSYFYNPKGKLIVQIVNINVARTLKRLQERLEIVNKPLPQPIS